jgi:hypothetical protein
MPQNPSNRRPRRLPLIGVALLAVLASVVLAACGGGSSSSTTQAAVTTPANSPGARGANGYPSAAASQHFKVMRECLAKHGVTLPGPGTSGQPGTPSSTSRTKMQEAFKACGGHGFAGHHFFGGAHGANFRAAYTKFSACMKEHGIDLPTANTSGSGPIFNTTGVNTHSTQFKEALKKCQSDLPHFAAPGAGGAPNGGGAYGGPGGAPGGPPGAPSGSPSA